MKTITLLSTLCPRVLTAAVLFATPALAHVEPRHFQGVLVGAAPVTPASASAPSGADAPVGIETLTREQLHAEYSRLEAERPSLSLGIGLMAAGAGVFVAGGVSLVVAIAVSSPLFGGGSVATGLATGLIIASLAAIGMGFFVLIAGVCVLVEQVAARGPTTERMERINARLEQLDGKAPGPRPASPPSSLRSGPESTLVLARF